jgi:hypothetical protein
MTLLDHARDAFVRGNPRAASALMAEHERLFPGGASAESRRSLLRRLCATPAGRGASECAQAPAAHALQRGI